MMHKLRTLAAGVIASLLFASYVYAGSMTLLGAGKPPASGGGPVTPNWVLATFNSTGRVQAASALSANTGATKFMLAFNVNMNAGTNGGGIFGGDLSKEFSARLVGGGDNIRLTIGDGTNDIQLDLNGTLSTVGEAIVIITVDTTQATAAAGVVAYQNGTPFTQSGVTWFQNLSPDFHLIANWALGFTDINGTSTPKFKWLWFDYANQAGAYPDITISGNRALFATGTLTSDGSNVTGTKPLLFIGGSAISAWTTPVNQAGTGGNTWVYTATIN